MNKLRLGIIGCGSMTDTHSKGLGFEELNDEVSITSVCDIKEELAIKAGASIGPHVHVTTDYKEMLPYVDAVLVVLPHDLHFEAGMFFAENKKHILMEKPLCNSEAECLALKKASEDAGILLMTAYPVRFWPEILKMKEIADSKVYGEIMQMSIWTEQFTKNSDKYHWSHTAKLGGGQFFSHGCHYIDLLLWFLGNPVKGVHLGTKVGTPWLMEEGTSNAVIEFESGALGYHFATWGARGSKMGYDFQIHFEKGMLAYSRKTGELALYQGMDTKNEIKTVISTNDDPTNKKTQLEILHFADCIKNKKKPLTDAYGSIQGLRVIWKMYDAEKHNQIADLRGLGLEG